MRNCFLTNYDESPPQQSSLLDNTFDDINNGSAAQSATLLFLIVISLFTFQSSLKHLNVCWHGVLS